MIDPTPDNPIDWPVEAEHLRRHFDCRPMTLEQVLSLLAAGFLGGIEALCKSNPEAATALLLSFQQHLRQIEAAHLPAVH